MNHSSNTQEDSQNAPPTVSQQQEGQQQQVGYIKHEKGKGYCVKSEKNPDWNGGCYPNKGDAEKRLRQVEYWKHQSSRIYNIAIAVASNEYSLLS